MNYSKTLAKQKQFILFNSVIVRAKLQLLRKGWRVTSGNLRELTFQKAYAPIWPPGLW